jgi:transcriptional regulator with XRE-family HTH domain
MTIVAALRRTRARSGRTLAAVAARAGITESNLSTIEHNRRSPRSDTIDRLAAALDVTLVPAATGGRNTAAEAGEHIARAVASGDSERAYRAALQLADDLGSAPPYVRLLLAAEAPTAIAPGWDALVAAVTEWRLQQAGLPAPDWVLDTIDPDAAAWTPPGAVLAARASRVPPAFLRRGVFVEEDELASV